MYQIFDKKNNLIHDFGEHAAACILDGINTYSKSFENAIIKDFADFSDAIFQNDANFSNASFENVANFSDAIFEKGANFSNVTFGKGAYFRNAIFEKMANFSDAIFENEADFENANFENIAYFTNANFEKTGHFIDTTFAVPANFTNAKIKNHQLTKPSQQEWEIIDWVLNLNDKWDMTTWHSSEDWKQFTRENMHNCNTAHCLAGGAQAWSSDEHIRKLDPQYAGQILIPNFQHLFFMSNEMASLHIEVMRKEDK